ncbi:MAG: FliH/SctL family protein [Actinomycetota bacterium]
MLAKVVKNHSVTKHTPFLFPEIGGANSSSKGVNDFIVPPVAEFQAVETAVKSEPFVSSNIEDILQNARAEAASIIARADEYSANIEQAAREKAIQEVAAQFDAEVDAKVSEIRAQLTGTIEKISALSDEITNRLEADLVKLALHIAKKVVGREVTIDREIAFTLVKVSLGKLHNRSVAEVHLNPEDFTFVETHRENLDFRGSLELVEDQSISIGGCLIHTETGDIDARIESQFDEIAHGLFN